MKNKWRPNPTDDTTYFFVQPDGAVEKTTIYNPKVHVMDFWNDLVDNIFQTKEEAKAAKPEIMRRVYKAAQCDSNGYMEPLKPVEITYCPLCDKKDC